MSSQAGAALATYSWPQHVPGQTISADFWGPQRLSQHLSDSTEVSQRWSWGVPHQPCLAAPGCVYRDACARNTCEGHTCACTGSGQVTLGGAFAFSTRQVGIEAKPKCGQ